MEVAASKRSKSATCQRNSYCKAALRPLAMTRGQHRAKRGWDCRFARPETQKRSLPRGEGGSPPCDTGRIRNEKMPTV